MTAVRQHDLSYGQLGGARYDENAEAWEFPRQPGITRSLKAILEPTISLEPTQFESGCGIAVQTASSRRQNIKSITDSDPTLVAAADLLPSLGQLSEAVLDSSVRDPLIGDQIAFGLAAAEGRYRIGKERQVLAIVGGVSNEAVRIYRLAKEEFTGQHTRLFTHSIDSSEHAWWVGPGTRIQQLCFSTIEGRPGKWLAIRHSQGISLLRPHVGQHLVESRTVYGKPTNPRRYPASRLDANSVLDLHIEMTGEKPLAHVAFNSWYERQFAVIDVDGHWSIWNIDGGLGRRGSWRLSPGPTGDIESRRGRMLGNDSYDVWKSLVWAGNASTLLVADRLGIEGVHISEERRYPIQFPAICAYRDADMILDIRPCPGSAHALIVLTTIRLFWIRLPVEDDFTDDGNAGATAEVAFSRRHFRAADLDLKMSVVGDVSELLVTLYSITSPAVTTFVFGLSESELPRSLSDPFFTECVRDDANLKSRDIRETSLRIRSPVIGMIWREVSATLRHAVEDDLHDNTAPTRQYFQLYQLFQDMCLEDSIYAYGLPEMSAADSSVKHLVVTKNVKSATRTDDNDFIVPDYVLDNGGQIREDVVTAQHIGGVASTREAWSDTFDWLKEKLSEEITRQTEDSGMFGSTANELIPRLKQLAEASDGMYTISELTGLSFFDDNVTELSLELQQVLDIIDRHEIDVAELGAASVPRSLAIRSVLPRELSAMLQDGEQHQNSTTLFAIFQKLKRLWHETLPAELPDQEREQHLKNLQHIATQLYLSSVGIMVEAVPRAETLTSPPAEAIEMSHSLPVRRKRSATDFSVNTADQSLPQTNNRRVPVIDTYSMLPTPERTTSPQSQQSPGPTETPKTATALQRYTGLALRPELSKSISRIHEEWTLGTDPSEYVWDDPHILGRFSEGEASMDEASIRRRKAAEKRVKRQKLDKRVVVPLQPPRVMPALSSQITVATQNQSQSRPVLPFNPSQIAGVLSSQATGRKMASAKKKRNAGF